jgi:DNA mismatch repair protein MutL
VNAIREEVGRVLHTLGATPVLDGREGYITQSGTPVPIFNPPPNRWYRDAGAVGRTVAESVGKEGQASISFAESGVATVAASPPVEQGAAPYEGPAFWQLKDRYIITTIKEGAIIVDQHVAHERILYEEILGNLRGKPPASQQLLFPLTLDFSSADFDLLEPMLPFLNRIGFSVREFGERSVIIDAIPSGFARFEEGGIFSEFIDEIRIHGKITSGYQEKFAAAVACRSAIKAGKPLTQPEMQYLVDRLFATSSPFSCPHGRPTIIRLTLDELDRRFGR